MARLPPGSQRRLSDSLATDSSTGTRPGACCVAQWFKTECGLKPIRQNHISQLAKNRNYTQYKKAPTFTVSCESLEQHTYRRGAPL